jgi:hypothetical protein
MTHTGSQTANAARIGGKLPPELYTISRDGALHSFVYLIDPLQSEAASPAAEVPGAGNDQSRVDTDVVSVAKLPSYTGGSTSCSHSLFNLFTTAIWYFALGHKCLQHYILLQILLHCTAQYGTVLHCLSNLYDVVWKHAASCNTGGHWKLHEKFYFNHRGAKVSAVDWHAASSMLIVAFSNGIFDLYEMPTFQNVHTLSVSSHRISATAFNGTGNLVTNSSLLPMVSSLVVQQLTYLHLPTHA